MSTTNAKNGSPIEPRAARVTTPNTLARNTTAGLQQDQGVLLAQIPDLDLAVTPSLPEKRAEGRIISQALSIKLVLGAGAALVIGAILPFLFGKASRPVTELPAWSNHGGSARIVENGSPTPAAAWPSWPTAPATAAAGPQTPSAPAPAILLPQPPQVGDNRPTALTEPSWRPSVAPPPATTPSLAPINYINPPIVSMNPPDNRTVYPGFERPVNPQTLQADNRNNLAAQNRGNDPRYDYRGNPIDTSSARRDVPAGDYSRDSRYQNAGGNYPAPAGPSSPLMPSGVPGPASTYRDQTLEPGVARFDGTIATPPVRTSYDRTGSNTN